MEDTDIIGLFLKRSDKAITETSKKYGNYCTSIAINILTDYSDAEEAVNDTYLAAWNAIPPSRPIKLSAFLGRITRNIALNKYDYNNAKKRNSEFETVLSELDEVTSPQDNVESEYDAERTAEAVSAFLSGTSYENRNVFIRRYWFSDSTADISKRFGISESKVKSMLFRIRKKLKEHLEKEGLI